MEMNCIPDPPTLGPVLQQHRKARRLTLDQLAAASGVSRSMLSQIERGQTNPTFSTLWSVTRALNLDLNELIGASATNKPSIDVMPCHFVPEIKTSDGLCVLRILSPVQSAGTTEWYELQMLPGACLASEPHAVGTREHLTLFEGQLEIMSGQSKAEIEAGGTARYAADCHHIIRNASNQAARALLVVAIR